MLMAFLYAFYQKHLPHLPFELEGACAIESTWTSNAKYALCPHSHMDLKSPEHSRMHEYKHE